MAGIRAGAGLAADHDYGGRGGEQVGISGTSAEEERGRPSEEEVVVGAVGGGSSRDEKVGGEGRVVEEDVSAGQGGGGCSFDFRSSAAVASENVGAEEEDAAERGAPLQEEETLSLDGLEKRWIRRYALNKHKSPVKSPGQKPGWRKKLRVANKVAMGAMGSSGEEGGIFAGWCAKEGEVDGGAVDRH